MTRLQTVAGRIRHTFWLVPAAGIVVGLALGLILPAIEHSLGLPDTLSINRDTETARGVLQALVGLAMSLAGITFSVIVVALVLASQQLSPRVLRSFERNPLNQLVLGVFLGTATYAACVLAAINEDSQDPVPVFATSFAMLLAGISLVLFVVFLHHLMRSLNASAVIRRIAAEGHEAIEDPYPRAAGRDADDERATERELNQQLDGLVRTEIRAPRAGYLASVEADQLLEIARSSDGFAEQRCAIGDFVITGGLLATVWTQDEPAPGLNEQICNRFILKEERLVDHDIAFPIRQLADIALKGLSPGINDPTTAENAMDSVADSLVRIALKDRGTLLRLDQEMVPRLRVARPSFDRLVVLGFDQVRRHAAGQPSFSVRLLELLASVRDLGGSAAAQSQAIPRQATLICEHAQSRAETDADRVLLQSAYERLYGSGSEPRPVGASVSDATGRRG